MKAKEQILTLAKKKFKPVFLLGWLRFLSYDELKSVDLLEPYDQAFDAHQVKTNKDWDKLVVEYTEHNLLSGLCILMRKLFTTIATENWSLASIYANDIENWLYILDDTEFKYNGSMCESDILDYYKKVGKKYKIDF